MIQDLQAQYTTYKNTLQQIAQKIGDVEQEAEEHKSVELKRPSAHSSRRRHPVWTAHRSGQGVLLTAHPLTLRNRLVLETLQPLPEDRKCFRMINGVLVERTVKAVLPALTTNAEGLKKVLDDLVKQYKVKQDELEKWKVGYPSPPCFRPRNPLTSRLQKKNNVQVVQS